MQFERLFQLISFKKDFKDHDFICIVDNARTHTASGFSINDFGMKPGTRCPVDQIEFLDEKNQKRAIECYDDEGISKGLLALAHKLGVFVPKKCSLKELKMLLSDHAAFKNVSRHFMITYV